MPPPLLPWRRLDLIEIARMQQLAVQAARGAQKKHGRPKALSPCSADAKGVAHSNHGQWAGATLFGDATPF